MPPQVRYSKEAILRVAFDIIREKGPDALNARAIAKALGCSTQPLFRVFGSMEDIHHEMLRMAGECFSSYIRRSAELDERPYKGTGMAYILFAKEEPELFKLLFMRDRVQEGSEAADDDENLDYVLEVLQQATHLNRDQALRFHQALWIFTHGLAVMVATHYIAYDPDLISRLLSDQFHAMCKQFSAAEPTQEAPSKG